jgi:hypothetical protein
MISLGPRGFHHSPLLATPIRAVEPAFLAMPGLPCAHPTQRQAIVVAIISDVITRNLKRLGVDMSERTARYTVFAALNNVPS